MGMLIADAGQSAGMGRFRPIVTPYLRPCLAHGSRTGDCIMRRDLSPNVIYGAIAVLLIVVGAVGYALWRDSQTQTIEFSVGENGVSITEG